MRQSAHTSLAEVGLENNAIRDDGALALAGALRLNRSVRVLSLVNNKIGDAGALVCNQQSLSIKGHVDWDEFFTHAHIALQELFDATRHVFGKGEFNLSLKQIL